jgi:putative chitinase
MALSTVFPHLAQYSQPLVQTLSRFDIDTINRQAAFLAQTAHESAQFTHFVENLNYSAAGLLKTWPRRFDQELANSCARNPEKIANIVYADRMGNGPPESGDGFRFRGRGILQITGKDNYKALSVFLQRSCDDTVAFLQTPEGAFYSAGWWWNLHRLNGYADAENIMGMTKVINGGLNGIAERLALYRAAKEALTEDGLIPLE